ncbi:SRPBCC family protein [Oceanobacillus sp. FSL W8-0428]|uniref:SRPBCC family protein n=1 Tax=Oceanobacillus TaxID=182709 RepID=UPI0030DC6ABE
MLAAVEKTENGYIATFARNFNSSVDEVWGTLIKNDKLQQWMPNLEVVDLRKSRKMKFNMNDGTGNSFEIAILDFQPQTYWQFEWGEGSVRFELEQAGDACVLVLKEYIPVLNDHVPKDLAGWHICLDMFEAALTGRPVGFPKESWKMKYEAYKKIVHPFLQEDK